VGTVLKILKNIFSPKIGIDLGTANTVIVTADKGIVLDQPSVISFHIKSGNKTLLAVGDDAKLMLGKTPINISATQPLIDGVIANFEDAEHMIGAFFKKAVPTTKYIKPSVVVCVPYGATPVEKRAIQQAIKAAGANRVGLLSEPMAAALGAGLPVLKPQGSLIVDIGGGTTEIAALSLGAVVNAQSIKVGGNLFNATIQQCVRKQYDLNIGLSTSEKLKIDFASATQVDNTDEKKTYEVKGLGSITGIPTSAEISQKVIINCLQPLIDMIETGIRSVLETAPPDLASDIHEDGLMLTGGGSLLKELDRELSRRLDLNVTMADNAKYSVANGACIAVKMGQKLAHAIDYDV
jgi:rod shape-determining protein MreB